MTAAEVFDFDKTLTYADTTLPLFCFRQSAARQRYIRGCYYLLALLVKARLLSVKSLKECLLNGFYAKHNQAAWDEHCVAFSRHIRTNKLYATTTWHGVEQWVVSASFEAVLRPLFPANVRLIGSVAEKVAGRWRLKQHAYGRQKVVLLKEAGVRQIFRLFTDSLADAYLMSLSDEIVWVQGDRKTAFTRQDWESKHGALPKV